MNACLFGRCVAVLAILLFITPASQGQLVRSAAGANAAAITAARDQFRVDIGGGTTAGANGSFGGLRREINWDGVPAASSAPNLLPANFFNVNSPRGVVFSTPGTGFQVSGATTDTGAGQPAAANFGNINPTYTNTFATFTPQRLFTAISSNVVDVTFFIAGTNVAALTNGFGAVFTDVDLPNTTSIQFFDAANLSLGTFFVPNIAAGTQTLSFLGVSYTSAIVSRVRITCGNVALAAGVNDLNSVSRETDGSPAVDVVVMDDFIYGEPIPEPTAFMLILAGAIPLAALARRRARRAV